MRYPVIFLASLAILGLMILPGQIFAGGLTGKKICVDPGHGGSDPGAVGPTGLQEKNVNLRVATVFKNCLVEYGSASVLMTRTSDVYVSLDKRCQIANNWGAHRFVSVHFNSSSDRSVNGTETFYYTYGSSTSKSLATCLQNRLVQALGLTNRGVKTASYYVLKYTNMPASLTESSFISNPYEEARLKDASYTWRIGYYHYVGVCDHYGVAP